MRQYTVWVVVVMGTLRMWPDDAVAFRGFLWIRPPAMRVHSPVRTRAVKLFTAFALNFPVGLQMRSAGL